MCVCIDIIDYVNIVHKIYGVCVCVCVCVCVYTKCHRVVGYEHWSAVLHACIEAVL